MGASNGRWYPGRRAFDPDNGVWLNQANGFRNDRVSRSAPEPPPRASPEAQLFNRHPGGTRAQGAMDLPDGAASLSQEPVRDRRG